MSNGRPFPLQLHSEFLKYIYLNKPAVNSNIQTYTVVYRKLGNEQNKSSSKEHAEKAIDVEIFTKRIYLQNTYFLVNSM